MKKRLSIMMVLFFLLLFRASAESPFCGSLIDPAGPEQPASAMWSLEDIFRWLSGDRAVSKRAGPFVEPSALPPAPTGYSLNEVMNFIQHYPYPAPVPRTGKVIYSYATGDDGDWKAGVIWPPRFTDHGDGTVTDNLTGLIWLKKVNCANATRDWPTASGDIDRLNFDGTMNSNDCGDTSNRGTHQKDWRTPNIKELQSLVDYGQSFPFLPLGHPFTGNLGTCWSSTPYAYKRGDRWDLDSWVLDFQYGAIDGASWYGSYDFGATAALIWPVRGPK